MNISAPVISPERDLAELGLRCLAVIGMLSHVIPSALVGTVLIGRQMSYLRSERTQMLLAMWRMIVCAVDFGGNQQKQFISSNLFSFRSRFNYRKLGEAVEGGLAG